MTEKLIWTVGVQAEAGPQLASAGTMEVEAYDKIGVTVADGATTAVDLGPTGAEMVCLVVIPAEPNADLTYEVDGNDVPLDAPLVLLGGAVGLAGNPASLTFKNQTGAEAVVEILVGRDATP